MSESPETLEPPIPSHWLRWLLPVFVGLELILAFGQYCQLPIDGDLAAVVVPAPWFRPVLHDPFGWAVLTRNAHYAASNRFFAHAAMAGYWRWVPRWLQGLASPIDSIYLAGALFSTAVQAGLLALLAAYVRLSGPVPAGRWWGWAAAALFAPLFQLGGYQAQLGIVSRSLTYTFFYAFPLALLLLWLWPFYRAMRRAAPLHLPWPQVLAWGAMAAGLAFNGPIVVAALGVLLLLGGAAYVLRREAADWRWCSGQALGLLAWFALLAAVSLWVGRNNTESNTPLSLGQLYQRLPRGIFDELTGKLGLPLLLGFVLLNAWLIRRFPGAAAEGPATLRALRWVGLFAALFVLLLPLGGYRPYRPFLVRNDSIMPVLLGVFLAYGWSTLHLLRHLPARPRRWYVGGVLLLSGIFLNANHLRLRENNAGERQALARLARARTGLLRLPATGTVMAWGPITDPQWSAVNAELLYTWGVTSRRVRYYQ